MGVTSREFLGEAAIDRNLLDEFCDPDYPHWAVFDKDLGYLLCDSVCQDGQDESHTQYRYQEDGSRRVINGADKPCRINTYGDSYTQGHQVSDGETWQEVLAAHFAEPFRNFGIGGHGVYQAYQRLMKAENSDAGAEYIVLNLFDDDHWRNIYSWRWLHVLAYRRGLMKTYRPKSGRICMFHSNPWNYLYFNPDSGKFEERDNPYPTPESLYQLCDPDHVYEAFSGYYVVQALLAVQGVTDVRTELLAGPAEALGLKPDFSTPAATAKTGEDLLRECAFRSTYYLLDKLKAFLAAKKKKMIVLFSYSIPNLVRYLERGERDNQPVVDYVKAGGWPWLDILDSHAEDYQAFNLSVEDYLGRYHVRASGAAVFGHYNPAGNLFFAYSCKDTILQALDPKPVTYR